MIVLHKVIYNPKIDYLICKNIINLDFDYDELKLRETYKKDNLSYYKEILLVKNYFNTHSIDNFTNKDINRLYELLTDDSSTLIIENKELTNIVSDINNSKIKDKNLYFRIYLVFYFYNTQNKLIIPYRRLSYKLYKSILEEDDYFININLNKLIKRTAKYYASHDLKDNENIIKQVYINALDFVKLLNLKAFGIYGSFSLGKANIYSDLDLFIIAKDEEDKFKLKKEALNYWYQFIDIPIDICIVYEDEIKDLKLGIINSLKLIYEV